METRKNLNMADYFHIYHIEVYRKSEMKTLAIETPANIQLYFAKICWNITFILRRTAIENSTNEVMCGKTKDVYPFVLAN